MTLVVGTLIGMIYESNQGHFKAGSNEVNSYGLVGFEHNDQICLAFLKGRQDPIKYKRDAKAKLDALWCHFWWGRVSWKYFLAR